MKRNYILILLSAIAISFSSCNDFLERESEQILPPEDVYSDPALIKSVLANFYGRISWGQHPEAQGEYDRLDEAVGQGNNNISNMDRNWWRVYDDKDGRNGYKLVHEINEFIYYLKASTALTEEEKAPYFAEVRVIRAWFYFCSARSLGGVPLVDDNLFEYTPGMDITTMQIPRATEAATYDYIIKECNEAAKDLPGDKTINAGRVNKWAAKMLEARAALYAASLAKYTTAEYNDITLASGAVGIPSEKADNYYKIALAAADSVILYSPYKLQDKKENKSTNFYEAVTIKQENDEVIWARDYKYPGQTHGFTRDNIPFILKRENSAGNLSVLLNLVEEFEPLTTSTPGQKHPFNIGTRENPVFYDTPDGPFEGRDYRLKGTVLVNGSVFANTEISYQAGLLYRNSEGKWDVEYSLPGEGSMATSLNGPIQNSERLFNKSGFSMRKYLDETSSAAAMMGSEVFAVRFRLAEAYLIAAEASLELSNGKAAQYINPVRERAGVQPLATVTMDNLIHERRVELAFEDHRYWDLKRWRIADKVWNPEAPTGQRRGLYAYKVNQPGDPNNGKWFFEEVKMDFIYPNNLKFEKRNYYAEMDNEWLNKNPKLEPNRYQQ
ncbi:MAG: RagB/SusD family nutrient uptake outer membrane protein [Tannerellaceae bacterium]|nr:RagB/SusD family nutrient uptake outer membrane protein [Tannerellaceae bacterium]